MKQIFFNGISTLFGLLLINGGLDKYFHHMPVPEGLPEPLLKDTAAFIEIAWLMPLVGLAEITGGILILFSKTRALGALVVFPVMVGVLMVHIFVAPEGLPIAIVIWMVLSWIIYENRHKYFPIIQ